MIQFYLLLICGWEFISLHKSVSFSEKINLIVWIYLICFCLLNIIFKTHQHPCIPFLLFEHILFAFFRFVYEINKDFVASTWDTALDCSLNIMAVQTQAETHAHTYTRSVISFDFFCSWLSFDAIFFQRLLCEALVCSCWCCCAAVAAAIVVFSLSPSLSLPSVPVSHIVMCFVNIGVSSSTLLLFAQIGFPSKSKTNALLNGTLSIQYSLLTYNFLVFLFLDLFPHWKHTDTTIRRKDTYFCYFFPRKNGGRPK